MYESTTVATVGLVSAQSKFIHLFKEKEKKRAI